MYLRAISLFLYFSIWIDISFHENTHTKLFLLYKLLEKLVTLNIKLWIPENCVGMPFCVVKAFGETSLYQEIICYWSLFYFFIYFLLFIFYDPPSSVIASCVGPLERWHDPYTWCGFGLCDSVGALPPSLGGLSAGNTTHYEPWRGNSLGWVYTL